ncbi:gliding motility-associated C-terminal domain-containing protein [candidate division WOR-3 bacterium]|nr:gliding motility-associated C-terminal domain-containing protein [candidate division WOR-3 bacterium]
MYVLLFLLVDAPIVITEVMSNVRGSESGTGSPGDRNEYVELYNVSSDTIDLATFFIDDFDGSNPDSVCAWEDDSILIKYPGVRIHDTRLSPHSYALILDREYTSTNTSGGYVQPYFFPDSTLILTTDDTSIGSNGIQNNDPLIVYSIAEACTSSFGTPHDSLDNFPFDPGDGISWERIDIAMPDQPINWHPSVDTAGCSPGQENSTTNAFDLALEAQLIAFIPAHVQFGDDVTIEVVIMNNGLRATDEYELLIFEDRNGNLLRDADELLDHVPGQPVAAFDSVSLFITYAHPSQGTHPLGFEVDFPYDRHPENNLAFRELAVFGEVGELAVSPCVFTPDHDGINDRLQIDYRLPAAGGLLTLLVFNARGVCVHSMCRREYCSEDRGTMYWNGVSDAGKAPTGMYIVYLEYHYQSTTTKAKKQSVLAR